MRNTKKDTIPANVKHFLKCGNNISYFLETEVSVNTMDNGLIPWKLYKYQKSLLNTFQKNGMTVVNNSRQIGITSLELGFCLWNLLFRSDINIVFVVNKYTAAKDLAYRFHKMFDNVSNDIKPKIKKDMVNKLSIELENGSRILFVTPDMNEMRGRTVNLLIFQDYAFTNSASATEILNSIFPVISSANGKMIISSTPCGYNHFTELYYTCKTQTPDNVIDLKWNVIRGRNAAWKKNIIKLHGQVFFDQNFDCKFV